MLFWHLAALRWSFLRSSHSLIVPLILHFGFEASRFWQRQSGEFRSLDLQVITRLITLFMPIFMGRGTSRNIA